MTKDLFCDTHATQGACDRTREWEARFPQLDPPWTHWQLDGQGRDLGRFPANQLDAALRRIQEYHALCDQVHAQAVQVMPDGSTLMHPNRCLILDRAEEDAINRPVPDGNMSPKAHYRLDGFLLLIVGVLAIVLLGKLLPWLADQEPAVHLAAAALPILAIWLIWGLRPRLMRRVWRARCPTCGKTMTLRQVAWPVLKDHWMGGPDFEQGTYHPEYACLSCGATVPMGILRRWFSYYHQLVYFTIGLLLVGLLVGWVALGMIDVGK